MVREAVAGGQRRSAKGRGLSPPLAPLPSPEKIWHGHLGAPCPAWGILPRQGIDLTPLSEESPLGTPDAKSPGVFPGKSRGGGINARTGMRDPPPLIINGVPPGLSPSPWCAAAPGPGETLIRVPGHVFSRVSAHPRVNSSVRNHLDEAAGTRPQMTEV